MISCIQAVIPEDYSGYSSTAYSEGHTTDLEIGGTATIDAAAGTTEYRQSLDFVLSQTGSNFFTRSHSLDPENSDDNGDPVSAYGEYLTSGSTNPTGATAYGSGSSTQFAESVTFNSDGDPGTIELTGSTSSYFLSTAETIWETNETGYSLTVNSGFTYHNEFNNWMTSGLDDNTSTGSFSNSGPTPDPDFGVVSPPFYRFDTTVQVTDTLIGLTNTPSTKTSTVYTGTHTGDNSVPATTLVTETINVTSIIGSSVTFRMTDRSRGTFFDEMNAYINRTVLVPQFDASHDDWVFTFSPAEDITDYKYFSFLFSDLFEALESTIQEITLYPTYSVLEKEWPVFDVDDTVEFNATYEFVDEPTTVESTAASRSQIGTVTSVETLTNTVTLYFDTGFMTAGTSTMTVTELVPLFDGGLTDTLYRIGRLPMESYTRGYSYHETYSETIASRPASIGVTNSTFSAYITKTGTAPVLDVLTLGTLLTWVGADRGVSSLFWTETYIDTVNITEMEVADGEIVTSDYTSFATDTVTFIGALNEWGITNAGFTSTKVFFVEQFSLTEPERIISTFVPALRGFQVQPGISATDEVYRGLSAGVAMPFPTGFVQAFAGTHGRAAQGDWPLEFEFVRLPYQMPYDPNSFRYTDGATWSVAWNSTPVISVTSNTSSFTNSIEGLGGTVTPIIAGFQGGLGIGYEDIAFGGRPRAFIDSKRGTIYIKGLWQTSNSETSGTANYEYATTFEMDEVSALRTIKAFSVLDRSDDRWAAFVVHKHNGQPGNIFYG